MRIVAGEKLQRAIASRTTRYSGPSLIYDLDRINASAQALALIGRRTGVDFIAAAKALPFDYLLGAVGSALSGFDASNCAEMDRLAAWRRQAGTADLLRYVAMTGPALTTGPQARAPLAERLTINIESESQLENFNQLAKWGVASDLGLRIGQPLYRHAGTPMTRFGFTDYDIGTIKRLVAHPRFAGFHCHVDGDQAIDGAHLQALEGLMKLSRKMDVEPVVYNLGGGFRGQTIQEIAVLCARARSMIRGDAKIIFEPGAWLTAQGGYAFCKVLAMRHRPDLDATLVTVDLARDSHCRWSNLRLENWFGPLPETRRLLFFGPTAYEGDYLGTFEWSNTKTGSTASSGKAFALFGGLTGYAAAYNADFNGIGKAKVESIGDIGAI